MKDGELYFAFKEHYYNNKLVEWLKELHYESFNKDMIFYSEHEVKKPLKLYLVDNYLESPLYMEYLKNKLHVPKYTSGAHNKSSVSTTIIQTESSNNDQPVADLNLN